MKAIDKHGWTKVTFGEVCKNLNLSERKPLENGIDRYIGLEHIETENLHIKTWGNVADGTTFTKKFLAGHVLFGKRRAYLKKAAVAEFDGLCSGDILVFEANEKLIDKRLLPFLVSSERFFDYAVKTSAGSLSPRTKFQDLAKFTFLLPPLNQQAKLAELLWAGDQTLVFKNNVLTKLISLKQNTIDKSIESIKYSNKTMLLKDVGEFKNGINKSKEEFGFGYPFVNLLDIFGIPTIKSKNFDLVNVSKNDLINYNLLKGDVLFVRSSVKAEGVGLTTLVIEDIENTVFSGFIIRFRQKRDYLISSYLEYCFHETNFRKNLLKNSTISANTNISQVSLGNLSILIPSKHDQIEIIKKIEKIKSTIEKLEISIKQLLQIQKELINQLF